MGLTRLGLGMLVGPSRRSPVVALDVKGWLSPLAAWEMGVDPERLVVVRCPDADRWPQVAAALVDGAAAMYAEVPVGVRHNHLRRLTALIRARKTGVVLRPLGDSLPGGVSHLKLVSLEVRWEGVEQGHGRLARRRLTLEATGRGVAGIPRRIEMVDDGSNVMRVISGAEMASGELTRAVG